MLEAKTRILQRPEGGTGTLYIPARVVNDSSFPFDTDDTVLVRIRGSKLIVEKDREMPLRKENEMKNLPNGKKRTQTSETWRGI